FPRVSETRSPGSYSGKVAAETNRNSVALRALGHARGLICGSNYGRCSGDEAEPEGSLGCACTRSRHGFLMGATLFSRRSGPDRDLRMQALLSGRTSAAAIST